MTNLEIDSTTQSGRVDQETQMG